MTPSPTQSPLRCDIADAEPVCDDEVGWHGAAGPDATCAAIATLVERGFDNVCGALADAAHDSDTLTASQACCVCGERVTYQCPPTLEPSAVPTPAPTPAPTVAPTRCSA